MKISIMRGLPGCGKSFWVAKRPEPKVVCSADLIHITDGIYKYDPLKAAEGHAVSLLKYAEVLRMAGMEQKDTGEVIVDNTNTGVFELAPYVQLAIAYQIPYEIVYILCPVEMSIKRNTHNVPATTILEMNRRLLTESLPSWWKVKVICQEDLNVQP